MSTTRTLPAPPAAPAGRGRGQSGRDNRDGLVMVLPTVVIVVAVVVVPVLWNVVLAFQDLTLLEVRDAGLFDALSLDNFADVLTGAGFWQSLWNTVVYSVFSTAGSVLVGLLAALSLRRPFPGRGVVRALMLLPYVAPVVAVAFTWETMLNPQYGIVNAWGASVLGWDQPVDFLGRAPYAMATVIAFEVWRYFPFAFLFLTARLLTVPREMEEAATVDGASLLQRFRHVVLPQLLPVVALLCVLRLIMTFNKFDDVYLLTGGGAGTEVAAVRVYDTLTGRFDVGAAAAQALVLSAILAVALFLYVRFFVKKGDPS
ncbi:ABC transporter permease subunit [Kineococcus sp. T13]|uniref:carbohydrate ABC transporter permease n=1 Tax=Kineococcus vitellinus TaxID=2696565 RepID=UPI0014124EA8|nr:sugar ABC transporter permease [Kineococcus vitellinus]NAZ76601.1 ABC transporter permease subunit [Kineococcus vitellinus]